ncbi:hypothetical protein D3C76_1587560 [compost metagenome]
MPLSSWGLCDALITMPASAWKVRVRYAMAGVGIGPRSITSAPADVNPASSADSNMYPEIRVSLPTSTLHAPILRNAMPAAQPSLSMKSGVIG